MRRRQWLRCFFLLFLSLIIGCSEKKSKIQINLLDVSGSMTGACNLVQKNLKLISDQIEALDKKDRVIVFCYRSHGEIVKVIDFTMPAKRGAKNFNILNAKTFLKNELQKVNTYSAGSASLGDRTDVIGSLKLLALYLKDLDLKNNIVFVSHFSDGLHNMQLKLHPKQKQPFEELRERLKEISTDKSFDPLKFTTFHWYGALCPDQKMSLTRFASLAENLRAVWSEFLKGKTRSFDYRLNY